MDIIRVLFKDPKVIDIGYRFILWFFFGGLYSFSAGYGRIQGGLISQAIAMPPSPGFSEIVGIVGFLVSAVSLFFKELIVATTKRGNRGIFKSKAMERIVFWLGKIASDFVLTPYNLMAFTLGWAFFLLSGAHSPGTEIGLFGIVLVPYLAIMVVLAGVSLVARAEPGEYVYEKLYAPSVSAGERMFFYIAMALAAVFTLLFRL